MNQKNESKNTKIGQRFKEGDLVARKASLTVKAQKYPPLTGIVQSAFTKKNKIGHAHWYYTIKATKNERIHEVPQQRLYLVEE